MYGRGTKANLKMLALKIWEHFNFEFVTHFFITISIILCIYAFIMYLNLCIPILELMVKMIYLSAFPTYLHSVSKETHHKFIGFPCDPGSRSGDSGRVVFYTLQSSSIYTLLQKKTTFHGVFLLRLSV